MGVDVEGAEGAEVFQHFVHAVAHYEPHRVFLWPDVDFVHPFLPAMVDLVVFGNGTCEVTVIQLEVLRIVRKILQRLRENQCVIYVEDDV